MAPARGSRADVSGDDDVVFFVVLAAGLMPVLGPVDPRTGNLDPTAIEASTWTGLRAVLTTNLYGIPDRMDLLVERCRRHDLVLLEDVAHAIDTRCDGRRIGEYLRKNPLWHADESPWKAKYVLQLITRNKIAPKTVCDVGCGAGELLRLGSRGHARTAQMLGL